MIQRGNSINKIRNYLIGKGINETFIKDTVEKIREDNSDQDFFSAIKLCKKKHIKFFVANNISLAFKTGASGVYLSSYNKELLKRNQNSKLKIELEKVTEEIRQKSLKKEYKEKGLEEDKEILDDDLTILGIGK